MSIEEVYEELSLFDFEEIKKSKIESQKPIDEKMYAILLANFIGVNSDTVFDYIDKYSVDDIFSLPDRFQTECGLTRNQNDQIRNLNKMNKLHKQLSTNEERYTITSTTAAIEYCSNLFADAKEQEEVHVLSLDTKNKIISADLCFKGSVNSSVAHPREIMSKAIANRAARIIISHNHPSGNPEPSEADYVFTKRMSKVGELMGIELLDHIIIGENSVNIDPSDFKTDENYFSFREQGVFENSANYKYDLVNEDSNEYPAEKSILKVFGRDDVFEL